MAHSRWYQKSRKTGTRDDFHRRPTQSLGAALTTFEDDENESNEDRIESDLPCPTGTQPLRFWLSPRPVDELHRYPAADWREALFDPRSEHYHFDTGPRYA